MTTIRTALTSDWRIYVVPLAVLLWADMLRRYVGGDHPLGETYALVMLIVVGLLIVGLVVKLFVDSAS